MGDYIKKIILFVFFLSYFINAYTIDYFTTDSVQNKSIHYLIARKTPESIDRIINNKWFKMTYISVPLIVSGSLVEMNKKPFYNLRNEYIPSFHSEYDNYLQYVPIFALVGMKAGGVESRSSWGRMLVSDAFSAALMATSVNVMKHIIDSRRPDGSALNSFPSGHSATAFMAATMFHKEYGVRSPWYSIGAYTVATATAVSRLLNNRHWVSDVMVGAGIGILTTELGYYFADLIFGKKGLKHPQYDFDTSLSDISSFLGLYMGFTMVPHQISIAPELNFDTSTGSTIGVEGAYYFTPYVGVGAELLVNSVPIQMQNGISAFAKNQGSTFNASIENSALNTITTSLGAYFSLPVSKRWYLGGKLLAGYGNLQGDKIDLVWNDMEMGTEMQSEFLDIKHANFFNAGSGISLSFWANKNFLAKGFFDYKVAPITIQYSEMSDFQLYLKSHQVIHSFTLGASVNIVW